VREIEGEREIIKVEERMKKKIEVEERVRVRVSE